MFTDTNAVAKNDAVTLTVTSDKLSPSMINMALATNGDQVNQLANKVLRSMTDAGTKNPSLTIQVVDSIIIFGAIQLERHFVERRVTEMLPIKDGTLTTGAKLKNVDVAPMTPDQVAVQLNNEAFNLKQSSRGLLTNRHF
ncbi:hypothetical protein H7R52_14605 [Weissella confusa]|uniref:Uncharacterized protein n=1 Tax=Weissella confusa TaxID=1583 RepID=A0A923NH95_WEICO|nr:hypothetical protein [Weissella confusa]